MLSIFGLPFHAAYGASKGGVVQLTKSLAVAWAPDGITVNVILPGWIDTDLTKKARQDMATLHEDVLRRTPSKRWGDPRDVGNMTAFLASDEAAWITGQVIPINGGAPTLLAHFDDPDRPAYRPEWSIGEGRMYFTIADLQSDVWVMQTSPQ